MCMQVLRRFWTFGLWWDGRRLPVHQVLVRLKSISRYFRFYITNHFKLISFKVLYLNKITKYPGPGISTCKQFGLWLSQFHFSKSEISKCLSESKLNSLVSLYLLLSHLVWHFDISCHSVAQYPLVADARNTPASISADGGPFSVPITRWFPKWAL